ncbi:MAG: hypothetical protein P8165_09845 [Deltaproteobacteria bacterium]|jgi:hypothetical protein
MCLNSLKRDICCIEGTKAVILVAPHAFDGDIDRGIGKDDENTGTLARELAGRYGFYAVVNERYKRTGHRHEPDMEAGFIDCNRIDQVTSFLREPFLSRIVSFKEAILHAGNGRLLIVHIHGAHDRSFDAYQTKVQCPKAPGILIGYGQGEVPGGNRFTAAETLVDLLIIHLSGQNGSGIPAVKTHPAYPNYCGRNPNNLNQLFRDGPYRDPRVQSIQIEIKKAYRRPAHLTQTVLALGAALSKLADDHLARQAPHTVHVV